MNMGVQLQRLLRSRGMTQAQLAKQLGYKSRQDVNNLCRNERWDVDTVFTVSTHLKVDPCYFFPRTEKHPRA
jgi:transcriptional regulator with XRE-family HTH domain